MLLFKDHSLHEYIYHIEAVKVSIRTEVNSVSGEVIIFLSYALWSLTVQFYVQS